MCDDLDRVRDNLLYALRGVYNEGRVFGPDMTYIVAQDDERTQTLKPDISFVQSHRLTPRADELRPFYNYPDLAVILSGSGETHHAVNKIYHRYRPFQGGVRELWVVKVNLKWLVRFSQGQVPLRKIHDRNEVFVPHNLFPYLQIHVGELFDGVLG